MWLDGVLLHEAFVFDDELIESWFSRLDITPIHKLMGTVVLFNLHTELLYWSPP